MLASKWKCRCIQFVHEMILVSHVSKEQIKMLCSDFFIFTFDVSLLICWFITLYRHGSNMHLHFTLIMLKESGPCVQTFCIEKDSYMDAFKFKWCSVVPKQGK